MDTRARQTAHVLLDVYGGFASAEDGAAQLSSFRTSMARLAESGSIQASRRGEDQLELDVTPMLVAAGATYQWLFAQLSAATGRSEEELVFDLRAFLDGQAESEQ